MSPSCARDKQNGEDAAAALTRRDHSRTYRYARHDPHHRLRLTSYQADRAPGARGKRLLRDRAFPEGRGGAAQLEAERDHPFGRTRFGVRQGSAACAGGDLSGRRAGARHLLWRAGHGAPARRQGRRRPSSRIRPRRGGGDAAFGPLSRECGRSANAIRYG